jgi:hypothetical protein
MLKKGLIFGIAATVFAAIMFTACPNEVEYRDKIVEKEVEKEKEKIVDNEIPVPPDSTALDEDSLRAALGDADSKIIALARDVALSDDLEIPAKKTLIVYAELDTGSSALTVEGDVIVAGGTLTATNAGIVTVTGSLRVLKGGTVDLDEAASLVGLGTKVSFAGGILAALWPTDAETIAAALGYVTNGILDVSTATHSLKLSELAEIEGISGTRQLIATAGTDEDAEEISIPAGAIFTAKASDTLNSVESLTVSGSLTASAATGAGDGIVIIVNTGGSLEVGEIEKLLDSSVGTGAALTTGDITAFEEDNTLTASAGSTVNGVTFPAQAAITALGAAEITIGGTLNLAQGLGLDSVDLVLAEEAVLVIPESAALSGDGLIKAEDGTITFAGHEGFTTSNNGIAANGLLAAASKILADAAQLTNSAAIVLDTTFGTEGGIKGIGSVVLAGSSAVDIRVEADAGGSGDEITLDDDTSLVGDITAASAAGTNDDVITVSNITMSIGSNKLQLADSDAANSGVKFAVVTFEDVQIQNGELISPVLEAFNVGIKTVR